jgi:hypothetical protein
MRNLPRDRSGWHGHHTTSRAAWLALLIVLHGCASEDGDSESPASLLRHVGLEPDGVTTVLVVFQAADCASARDRLLDWNDRTVRVVGVLVGPQPEGVRGTDQVTLDVGLRFPIVTSRRADRRVTAALRALGYRSTPVAVGFDSSGRLRRVEPLDRAMGPERVEAFLSDIEGRT